MPVTLPYTIQPGDLADATAVQACLSALAARFNAGITNDDISAQAYIDGAKLLDSSILGAKITNGQVSTAKLEDSTSLTTGISAAKLQTGCVTTAKIADSTGTTDGVTTAKIADAAVTGSKLSSGAAAQNLAGSGGIPASYMKTSVFSGAVSLSSNSFASANTGLSSSGSTKVIPLVLYDATGSTTNPFNGYIVSYMHSPTTNTWWVRVSNPLGTAIVANTLFSILYLPAL